MARDRSLLGAHHATVARRDVDFGREVHKYLALHLVVVDHADDERLLGHARIQYDAPGVEDPSVLVVSQADGHFVVGHAGACHGGIDSLCTRFLTHHVRGQRQVDVGHIVVIEHQQCAGLVETLSRGLKLYRLSVAGGGIVDGSHIHAGRCLPGRQYYGLRIVETGGTVAIEADHEIILCSLPQADGQLECVALADLGGRCRKPQGWQLVVDDGEAALHGVVAVA